MGIADEDIGFFLVRQKRGGQLFDPRGDHAVKGLELVVEKERHLVLLAIQMGIGTFLADDCQLRTIQKRVPFDLRHAVGKDHGREEGAAVERPAFDLRHAIGQND